MTEILSFVICKDLEIGLTLFARYKIHVSVHYFGHPEQPDAWKLLAAGFVCFVCCKVGQAL
jgi:hypothetical protein